MLLCGLLVAGVRGPAEPPQAFAQAATTSAESAPANPKPGTQEAPATITGSWQAESLSMELKNGNHRTFGRQDGVVTAVITEKTFTLRLGENVLSEMEYVLDAKQTPWTIDMTSKEGVMLGICSRQGDDLKISLNDQAKGRPTDFDANRNGMVLVLLRHRYVQLSVINADGTGLHQVAAMPDFTRLGSPDWSRDGSKIAFDGWREFYGKDLDETHVFVINADGAGLKDLGMGCMPSWSPDDKQLTYCQYSEGRGVWVMNADGSGRRLIDGGGWGSQWSPVRNEIAYARNSDICIYDLGTGTSRTLLKKSYRQIFWGFGWSPDGKWISFLGGLDDGGRELAAVSIDGEEKGFKVLAAQFDARHHDSPVHDLVGRDGQRSRDFRAGQERPHAAAIRSRFFQRQGAEVVSGHPCRLLEHRPRHGRWTENGWRSAFASRVDRTVRDWRPLRSPASRTLSRRPSGPSSAPPTTSWTVRF